MSKGRRQLIGEMVTRFVEETLRATINAPTDTERERRVRQLITDPKFREHLGRIKKAAADTNMHIDQRMCEVILAANQLYRAFGLDAKLNDNKRLQAVTLLLNIFRQPDEDEIHERRRHHVVSQVHSFVTSHLTRQDRLPRQHELIAETETEVRQLVDAMRAESLPVKRVAIQITCAVTWLLAKLKADPQLVQKDIVTLAKDLENLLLSRS